MCYSLLSKRLKVCLQLPKILQPRSICLFQSHIEGLARSLGIWTLPLHIVLYFISTLKPNKTLRSNLPKRIFLCHPLQLWHSRLRGLFKNHLIQLSTIILCSYLPKIGFLTYPWADKCFLASSSVKYAGNKLGWLGNSSHNIGNTALLLNIIFHIGS